MTAQDLALMTALIGEIAEQSTQYKQGLAELIRKSEKPFGEYTIQELININCAYQAQYQRVYGHDRRNPIHRSPAHV